MAKFQKKNKHKINEEIFTSSGLIRVVNLENGSAEIKLSDALKLADEESKDIVQITEASIPICKLIEYSKFLYEESKQKRKNTGHVQKLKQVQFSPSIAQNDIDHKTRHIREFIEDGCKVEVLCKFQGRQKAHKEIGYAVINEVIEKLSDVAKQDGMIKDNGNNITVNFVKK